MRCRVCLYISSMARSVKKSPFVGVTTAVSEKQDKRYANRAYRRKIRVLSKQDDAHREAYEDAGPLLADIQDNDWQDTRKHWEYPVVREVSNVYMFSKDGRWRIDPDKYPDLMRK